MCGIAGVIGRISRNEGETIVQSMLSALDHRGPDDSGFHSWTFGTNVVVFGNTRLSILDLSAAGHQPMTERSGCCSIAFKLQKLLDPELFQTSTDTEVILHAYRRWPQKSFGMLRGMFAFALLDKNAGKVHLVRDPLGIKPLYYKASSDGLLFASEVQALLASGRVERRINAEAVSHFLRWGWVGKAETAISGIELLQPGEALTADLSGDEMKWTVSAYEAGAIEAAPECGDRNESAAQMLHLLQESVKYHLVSDVPVGLFLSGGIDSTAILHLMREAGCTAPKTFTVVFPEKDFSESLVARQAAQRYETEHHELILAESDLLARLPAALAAMDQPTMDGVNTFVIANAVHSAGLKVALSGLGSDELFAGYPSFRRAQWARTAAKVPQSVRMAVAAGGRSLLNGRHAKLWDLLASDCTPESAYRISRRLFGDGEMTALLDEPSRRVESREMPFSGDEINEISRLESEGYMTGLLLRDTDFMSMASSLEVRVPFVDKVVVRYARQLPGKWKIARSKPKALLLESLRGAIPDYVWDRPKMGFVFPFDKWMRSALRHEVETTLNDRKLAEAVGLAPEALLQVWDRFLKGTVRWSKPWSLFVLLRWCQRQHASI